MPGSEKKPSPRKLSHEGASEYDATSLHEPLPYRIKFTMGIGESIQACYTVICGFFLNAYLLEVACLPPSYVGMIQMIAGAFDSFNDPIIGSLSDRTRTRWGRRRPWLLFASLPLGLFYFGIWNVLPRDNESIPTSDESRLIYYLAMYMGISIGITCIQVQIGALVPELTLDYDERTTLSTYRLGIGNVIALIAVLIHSSIVTAFLQEGRLEDGYRTSGGLFGIWICFAGWFTFWNIKEKFNPELEDDESIGCCEGLQIVFKNKAFICVVIVYLSGPTAVCLVQTNLLLYCKYILNDEALVDYIIAIVQGMALVMLPWWNFVGRKWGKKMCYYMGGTVLATSLSSLYFIHSKTATIVVSFIAGTSLGIPYMIPYSMLPDVIEEDEIKTGKRREGVYFGFFTIFLKLSVTSAFTATNFALELAGYVAPKSTCGGGNESSDSTILPDSQPERVIQVMRLLVGPIPAFFFCVAMFFVWKFPITRATHEISAAKVVKERTRKSIQLRNGESERLANHINGLNGIIEGIESDDVEKNVNSATHNATRGANNGTGNGSSLSVDTNL